MPREPAHKRDIISQLRLHDRTETPGVCTRAIQEIEKLTRERDEAETALCAVAHAIRHGLPTEWIIDKGLGRLNDTTPTATR